MLKRGQARVKEAARRLKRAAKKHNESADATCSVAGCFDSDGDLSDEMFDSVLDTVTELVRVSLEKNRTTAGSARAARRGSQAGKKCLSGSGSRDPSSLTDVMLCLVENRDVKGDPERQDEIIPDLVKHLSEVRALVTRRSLAARAKVYLGQRVWFPDGFELRGRRGLRGALRRVEQ